MNRVIVHGAGWSFVGAVSLFLGAGCHHGVPGHRLGMVGVVCGHQVVVLGW